MALPIKKEGIIGTEKPTFSNEFVGFSVYFFRKLKILLKILFIIFGLSLITCK